MRYETKLANDLMQQIRDKKMSIKRLTFFANIPNRNFYDWLTGEVIPSKKQTAKMEILLQLLKAFQAQQPPGPARIDPLEDPEKYASNVRETLETCCFLKRKMGAPFAI